MYERYWKLERSPFNHDRSPRSFYPSHLHSEALVKLKYLIEYGKGAAVLVGASGAGKTHILEMIRQERIPGPVVHLVYPQLNPHELVSFIAHAIGCDGSDSDVAFAGMDLLLCKLESRLCELTQSGKSPVIMLDDAHLIEDRKVFQTLHQLMNFQCPDRSNFTMILSGQPELMGTLRRMDQISERIDFHCLLQSLTQTETNAYIQHRLRAAGRTELIFDESAERAIFELSSGIPRRISRLCDFSMLVGYANQLERISAQQVEGVHAEISRSSAAA